MDFKMPTKMLLEKNKEAFYSGSVGDPLLNPSWDGFFFPSAHNLKHSFPGP